MEKIKVLLVDDDLLFGNIATKILQAADYEVYFQNSLFGIESLIMKLNPNIIILDVMVGEENSLERINDIRLAAEDIPIIFVSSDSGVETEEQAITNGAMVYLEKPFSKEKLFHDCRTSKEEIPADRYLIENVLGNLIENAVKYSEAEADIEVSIRSDEHFAIVSVKDNGIGIDRKYQKKIFEQFYRIPGTQHKNGYGIGLALVKYAVRAHGGTIRVESEPGKGSTFTFTLPLKKK